MFLRMARRTVRGELPVMLEAVSAGVKDLGREKIQLAPLEPRTRLDFVRYPRASSPEYVRLPTAQIIAKPRPYTIRLLLRQSLLTSPVMERDVSCVLIVTVFFWMLRSAVR